jgi:hypothetical protein
MDLEALVVGVIGMIAISMKVVDFLKQATNLPGSKRAVLTQLVAWLGATGVVFLYSASDFGSFDVGGVAIDDMQGATKVILGLAIGSAASVGVDFKKAIDGSDSAAVPSLNI